MINELPSTNMTEKYWKICFKKPQKSILPGRFWVGLSELQPSTCRPAQYRQFSSLCSCRPVSSAPSSCCWSVRLTAISSVILSWDLKTCLEPSLEPEDKHSDEILKLEQQSFQTAQPLRSSPSISPEKNFADLSSDGGLVLFWKYGVSLI